MLNFLNLTTMLMLQKKIYLLLDLPMEVFKSKRTWGMQLLLNDSGKKSVYAYMYIYAYTYTYTGIYIYVCVCIVYIWRERGW